MTMNGVNVEYANRRRVGKGRREGKRMGRIPRLRFTYVFLIFEKYSELVCRACVTFNEVSTIYSVLFIKR